MNLEIKKNLTSNWFKLLQNAICNDVINIENKKVKFKSKVWKIEQKMKVVENIEFCKMVKFLKK